MDSLLPSAGRTRIGLSEAISQVLAVLKKMPSSSIASIARATGLDRRTVDKVISLLLNVQKELQNKELTKFRAGRQYIVRLQERKEKARDFISTVKQKLRRG